MLLNLLTKSGLLKDTKIEETKTILLIRNKDRASLQENIEKFFKSNKVKYNVLKKPTELLIDKFNQKLVFKPITAKGVGGLKFEAQLVNDFNKWFEGYDIEELKHGDTIKEVIKLMSFKQSSKNSCKQIGKANTKRPPTFAGSSTVTVTNNQKGNVGDIEFKINNKVIFASLKFSNSFYIYNATVIDYFKSTDKKTRKNINEFFGFNGEEVAKGFGKEYYVETIKNPNYNAVKVRLESLIKQALGPDILLITKISQGKNWVNYVDGFNHKVILSGLNKNSYLYAEKNVRKYMVIKTNGSINGHEYEVDFQFRGTTATDTGPRYLRILLKPK